MTLQSSRVDTVKRIEPGELVGVLRGARSPQIGEAVAYMSSDDDTQRSYAVRFTNGSQSIREDDLVSLLWLGTRSFARIVAGERGELLIDHEIRQKNRRKLRQSVRLMRYTKREHTRRVEAFRNSADRDAPALIAKSERDYFEACEQVAQLVDALLLAGEI